MSASPATRPEIRLTRPIVLVGLMGAGKTSVGRRLAAALGADFYDSDHEIEAAAGMEVREIFERFGETYFREGEKRVISRLLSGPASVIATGGGAFMSEEIRQEIADRGVSVWIRAELELLWERVKDKPTRPLLMRPDAKEVLAGLIEARYPVYAEATITVDSEPGLPHERMAQKILEAVQARDRDEAREPVLVRG